jgi:hypothetical protein
LPAARDTAEISDMESLCADNPSEAGRMMQHSVAFSAAPCHLLVKPQRMSDELHAINGRCPKCGGEVFHAVPSETSDEEFANYRHRKTMQMGPITWDPTWIPDGDYCYNCNWFDEKTSA